ncbi:MAG TPA: transketolase, partial [Ornithinibacter sp.]|nr:transketolase [Ornithinibacter sp.]
QGWRDVVGDSGRSVSIEHFGASADASTLFREFGFTPEAVVKAAKESLAAARKAGQVPGLNDTAPRARKDTGTDVGTPGKPSRKSAAGA